jgi:hypothetical protein
MKHVAEKGYDWWSGWVILREVYLNAKDCVGVWAYAMMRQ